MNAGLDGEGEAEKQRPERGRVGLEEQVPPA